MSLSDAFRWNTRYSNEKYVWENYPPKQLLLDYESLLPSGGLVLDAASGLGATGRYLSRKGFQVISLDISINGLRMAQEKYQDIGLPFHGAVFDLSTPWLPEDHFCVILNFCFLERGALWEYQKSLKPGGLLFFESFVKDREDINYSNHYLEKGELPAAFKGFDVIHYGQIDWMSHHSSSHRKVDQLVARKPK